MEEAAVHSEAPSLTAEPKGQTIKHHTKDIPAKSHITGLRLRQEEFSSALRLLPSHFFHELFSQFTVLDEDALSELVSFLEDLLIVDVGHG